MKIQTLKIHPNSQNTQACAGVGIELEKACDQNFDSHQFQTMQVEV